MTVLNTFHQPDTEDYNDRRKKYSDSIGCDYALNTNLLIGNGT